MNERWIGVLNAWRKYITDIDGCEWAAASSHVVIQDGQRVCVRGLDSSCRTSCLDFSCKGLLHAHHQGSLTPEVGPKWQGNSRHVTIRGERPALLIVRNFAIHCDNKLARQQDACPPLLTTHSHVHTEKKTHTHTQKHTITHTCLQL